MCDVGVVIEVLCYVKCVFEGWVDVFSLKLMMLNGCVYEWVMVIVKKCEVDVSVVGFIKVWLEENVRCVDGELDKFEIGFTDLLTERVKENLRM